MIYPKALLKVIVCYAVTVFDCNKCVQNHFQDFVMWNLQNLAKVHGTGRLLAFCTVDISQFGFDCNWY